MLIKIRYYANVTSSALQIVFNKLLLACALAQTFAFQLGLGLGALTHITGKLANALHIQVKYISGPRSINLSTINVIKPTLLSYCITRPA